MSALLKSFEPAAQKVEAQCAVYRQILDDLATADYETPPWPLPMAREKFNDDDLYLFDKLSREIVQVIGCKEVAAELIRRGQFKVPAGHELARGMSAKYLVPPLWRAQS